MVVPEVLAWECIFPADELDIDGKSLEYARENIKRNREKVGDLDERITVFDNSPDDDIFPVEKLGIEKHYRPTREEAIDMLTTDNSGSISQCVTLRFTPP